MPAPVAAPPTVEPVGQAVQEQPCDAASGGYDPLEMGDVSAASDVQHARVLMLLSGARQAGAPCDKRILAAKWLLLHHAVPPRQPGSDAADADQPACGSPSPAEEAGAARRPQRSRKKVAGKRSAAGGPSTGSGCAEEADEAAEEAGWDPLLFAASRPVQEELQHARLLLLLAQAQPRKVGGRSKPMRCGREMAATWLVCGHLPEAREALLRRLSARAAE